MAQNGAVVVIGYPRARRSGRAAPGEEHAVGVTVQRHMVEMPGAVLLGENAVGRPTNQRPLVQRVHGFHITDYVEQLLNAVLSAVYQPPYRRIGHEVQHEPAVVTVVTMDVFQHNGAMVRESDARIPWPVEVLNLDVLDSDVLAILT